MPRDGSQFRKVCISLSIRLHSDLSYFMGLPIEDLAQTVRDTAEEAKKYGRRKK